MLNALPGAYFCSVNIANQIFDSRALRVDEQTLQNMCLPQQPPTAQPPTPFRCAQQLPINQNDLLEPNSLRVSTATSVTNTINLQAQNPTPTITIAEEIERTIPPLVVETPIFEEIGRTIPPLVETPTLNQTEQQTAISIGIGVGVGIGVAILLAVLVIALIVGVVCCVKKRDRNAKRRRTLMDRCKW